jgi:hypothetical protein
MSAAPLRASPQPAMKTRWVVRDSEGFDALSFLSPLSGDPFYLRYYEKEVADFTPRMPASAMATLKALKARSEQANIMLSPFLDLRFSAAPDSSIADLLASAADPDARLLPRFRASPYWDEDEEKGDWAKFKEALPAIAIVLRGLQEGGFAQFRQAVIAPRLGRIAEVRAKLAGFDPISGAEFYTGRTFDPTIEIILLQFSNPHGIKVIGQRFLSGITYSDDVHIRTAGHEILHPPLDKKGEAWTAALKVLERDALIARVVKEHDPKFGYNDLDGLLDEDITEALDQLIAEKAGVARDPRERWASHDGGMHIIAAAVYGLMQRDGFARSGGNLEQWLLRQARTGALAPASLHAAAARVIGRPVDRLWPPPEPSKA